MEGLSGREIVEALGTSEPFLEFQEQLSRVAPVDRPVLLMGERGTGKELAAHRLHYLSRAMGRTFRDSELFDPVAVADRVGVVRVREGGVYRS